MSLCLRIAFQLRRAADSMERLHRRRKPWPHQWEINKRARQFVANHAHLDLDELTDLAIKRGIYSSKQPRAIVRRRINCLRKLVMLRAECDAQLDLISRDQLKFRELLGS